MFGSHKVVYMFIGKCVGFGGQPQEKGKVLTEVSRDTYDSLVQKSTFAVGLFNKGGHLALYKPVAGVRVANEDITLQDRAKVPWSIGAYLRRVPLRFY